MRFSLPRSMLLGVAVVLVAAATPAQAIGGARLERRARPDTLPATHTLLVGDTGNSLSQHYYGSRGGALTILWSNALKRWPPSKRIVASKRYHTGDTIVIPKPPKASIHPPQRSNAGIKERGR